MSSEQTKATGPQTEELFELIVESSADFAIFTTDTDGNVTTWNIGAERLFGFPKHHMLGMPADVIFTPEDCSAGAPAKERAQALACGRALDERWHQRFDGSRFWASGLMMPLKRSGEGFLKITRDRTEQHEADERLKENEERFRLLATSIPQLVFRTLSDGTRTWGSPQWIEFTGLSLEQSLDMGWMDALHPEDRALTRNAWHKAEETGEYYAEHRVRRQADGEYLWHQTRARPIERGQTGGDWVGTMTDIHYLRLLQGRQQVMVAELQHRTRNLMAVVLSIARQTVRLSETLEDFSDKFTDRLQAISRVQDMLARVEGETIRLDMLVKAEVEAHIDENQISEKVMINGPPVALPALAAQTLSLALHELTTNAIKYGALARPTGKLVVKWDLETNGSPPKVTLEWIESGVAITGHKGESRKGYGSILLEQALPRQLDAETKLEFGADGVYCRIRVPLSAASATAGVITLRR